MGIKELFLQKGWAGKTITRAETVDRLNPLVARLSKLTLAYRSVQPYVTGEDGTHLAALMKRARTDVGKLKETVFSAGGVAYNATDLEAADYALDGDDRLDTLHEQEQAFYDAVADEDGANHQMRTRGVLQSVLDNSQQRLDFLKALGRRA